MRLFSASFSSLLLLPLLSSSAAAAASAPTDASLFLHPSTSSSGSDAAASISPAQLRQLLAYHLHLPGEEHLGYGARAAPRVWKWAQARVGDAGALFAGKQSAKLVVLANEDAGELQWHSFGWDWRARPWSEAAVRLEAGSREASSCGAHGR